MPKPRSPERDKAFEIYKQHGGNIENRRIAEQLGVDEKVIAVWKSRDSWAKKNNVVQQTNDVQQKNKSCTSNKGKKKASNNTSEKNRVKSSSADAKSATIKTDTQNPKARFGNKNAVGNSGGRGTIGNKNAVTTGAYETINLAGLTDEEKELLNAPVDIIAEQHELLKIERIRRHRMLKRIAEAEAMHGGMVIESVIKTKAKGVTESLPLTDVTQTVAGASINRVLKIEDALTRVNASSQRAISQLHKMETGVEASSLTPPIFYGEEDLE